MTINLFSFILLLLSLLLLCAIQGNAEGEEVANPSKGTEASSVVQKIGQKFFA
jgi:hypothetical protein